MPASRRLFFMKEYFEIEIIVENSEKREILAALLPDLGFIGMEETDTGLKAYAETETFNQRELDTLLLDMGLNYELVTLKEQNWNASWESNFEPVIIPGKIYIRADFHPDSDEFEHKIHITPKMSFGTGHHATTRMMMLEMLEMDLKGKRIFDFGTGTGVLSILAHQLGAGRIVAIDNDQWSIENARENVDRNGCDKIEINRADNLDDQPVFDVILANINKHVLLQEVAAMDRMLASGGEILISGLLSDDYKEIATEFSTYFPRLVSDRNEGNWIAMRFKKVL